MAVYAISDLHLAISVNKPMDIFGGRWKNYMERLKYQWDSIVNEKDYVIIPGDISWATYLEEGVADFRFIDTLPGKKIISKGNHDYWWTTNNKLQLFLQKNSFETISFMHNNSYDLGSVLLCGTRGWSTPGDENFTEEDRKIYNREIQRLELSLMSIPERQGKSVIVALHYPPFNAHGQSTEFINLIRKYEVTYCIYGHLHSEAAKNAIEGNVDGVEYKMVSSDHLSFKPLLLFE